MTSSASAASAASPAASQPSHSARLEQFADELVGPQADGQRHQHAEGARGRSLPSHERRFGAAGGGGTSVDRIISSKTSISAGVTIAVSCRARAASWHAGSAGSSVGVRRCFRFDAEGGRSCGERSCEMVSDQELQRAVEPDMRQRQLHAVRRALELWRPEAHEADRRLGLLLRCQPSRSSKIELKSSPASRREIWRFRSCRRRSRRRSSRPSAACR